MPEPRISVIVPVYNTEQYLHRCIDSILGQTFTDFELLLVDDGSKDNSGAICDEYAARDPRIRVFHKPNGGVSSARNVGLDNARGEWIAFIDSDDWVEPSYLSVLIKLSANSDLSICDFSLQGTKEVWSDKIETEFIDKKHLAEFYIRIYPNVQVTASWGKLFKLNLIRKGNISFDEDLPTLEDNLFVLDYLSQVKSISCTDKRLYNYWRGEVGLSKIKLNNEMLQMLAAKIDDSICRLSNVCGVDRNILLEKVIGSRLYYYILTDVNSFHTIKRHFQSVQIDKSLLRRALTVRSNRIGRKHRLVLKLFLSGHYNIAALLYRIWKIAK